MLESLASPFPGRDSAKKKKNSNKNYPSTLSSKEKQRPAFFVKIFLRQRVKTKEGKKENDHWSFYISV